jgi:hypothetical protein
MPGNVGLPNDYPTMFPTIDGLMKDALFMTQNAPYSYYFAGYGEPTSFEMRGLVPPPRSGMVYGSFPTSFVPSLSTGPTLPTYMFPRLPGLPPGDLTK